MAVPLVQLSPIQVNETELRVVPGLPTMSICSLRHMDRGCRAHVLYKSWGSPVHYMVHETVPLKNTTYPAKNKPPCVDREKKAMALGIGGDGKTENGWVIKWLNTEPSATFLSSY